MNALRRPEGAEVKKGLIEGVSSGGSGKVGYEPLHIREAGIRSVFFSWTVMLEKTAEPIEKFCKVSFALSVICRMNVSMRSQSGTSFSVEGSFTFSLFSRAGKRPLL